MTVKLSSAALGAVVIVLAGVASYVGATLAQPPAPAAEPTSDGADADMRSHQDELDRRIENLERRMGAVEEIAISARDLAESLRDQRTSAGAAAPGGSGVAAPPAENPGTGSASPEPPAKPGRELTEEEVRAERAQKIRDAVRRDNARDVPALLASYADTRPAAVEKRRQLASIEARQMAVSLAVTPEQATQLGELFENHAVRLAQEVGPLVKDGLDKADPVVVEAGLTRVWDDMDRRAKEILGDTRFASFGEQTQYMRTVIRDVLAESKNRR